MKYWDWQLNIQNTGRVRCEPGWRLNDTWSRGLRDCDLWYVWDGRGSMRLRDRELELRPGVCLWMRPGGMYLAEQDSSHPLGVTYVHFTPVSKRGKPLLTDNRLPGEVFFPRDPSFFTAVIGKLVRLLRTQPAPTNGSHARQEAELLLRILIAELLAPASHQPDPSVAPHQTVIERQQILIQESPSTAKPVRILAREASLSPDHYSRIFRTLTGVSPREFIQQSRLHRACQLLRESSATVTEVAANCGYSDIFQFSRIFKNRMGLSPAQWRSAQAP